MSRARNIKPGFFLNEILGTSDPLLQLLFAGLWCLADREGRLEDRPLRIKAEIFPYRETLDINGYLTELSRLGFILCYEYDGNRYIQILNFLKHQRPHHTEKDSIIPVFSNGCLITRDSPLKDGENPPDTGYLIPDILIPYSHPKPVSEKPLPAPTIKKVKYRDSVSMTEEEYQKLLAKHGQELTDKMLDTLNNYKGSSGKKYKSDYLAILSWVEEKVLAKEKTTPANSHIFSGKCL